MSNFKVGDRVRVVNYQGSDDDRLINGLCGSVNRIGPYHIDVTLGYEDLGNWLFTPDEIELVEDYVIRAGDYVENVSDYDTDIPPGFAALVEAVHSDSVTFNDVVGDWRFRPSNRYRKVTLASLYADEEAYHAMRDEADYENHKYDLFNANDVRPWPGSEAEQAAEFPELNPEPTAGSILREAADIVDGQRNKTHGVRERSFQAIADFWNVYLSHRNEAVRIDYDLTEAHCILSAIDVAEMMVLLKVARQLTGEPIADHYVDQAGYAGVAGELAARR